MLSLLVPWQIQPCSLTFRIPRGSHRDAFSNIYYHDQPQLRAAMAPFHTKYGYDPDYRREWTMTMCDHAQAGMYPLVETASPS